MRTPFLVSPPSLPAFRQQNCASPCVWRYNNVPLRFSSSPLKNQHFSHERDKTPILCVGSLLICACNSRTGSKSHSCRTLAELGKTSVQCCRTMTLTPHNRIRASLRLVCRLWSQFKIAQHERVCSSACASHAALSEPPYDPAS